MNLSLSPILGILINHHIISSSDDFSVTSIDGKESEFSLNVVSLRNILL